MPIIVDLIKNSPYSECRIWKDSRQVFKIAKAYG